ncbi:MAG TPA: 50S ribosomal protein L21 [Actinomycetota bacterium]|nr:50S ribosomal protein L21 [Actinomycetota bacterium]
MYAVIRVGGKQQRVKQGDVIEAEYQKGETPGAELTFKPLLVVDDDGTTHHGKDLEKALVTAKVVGEGKGDKVKVVKYRPKTRYSRHGGHRQMLSLLEISEVRIGAPAKKAAAKAAPKGATKAEEPADAEPAEADDATADSEA